MRILLVEDEPSAARMLAKGLREEAYAVDVAADGEIKPVGLGVGIEDIEGIMKPGETVTFRGKQFVKAR